MDGRLRAVSLGQFAPRRARPEYPEDAFKALPVAERWPPAPWAALALRELCFDELPLLIRHCSPSHRLGKLRNLNQLSTCLGIASSSPQPEPQVVAHAVERPSDTVRPVWRALRRRRGLDLTRRLSGLMLGAASPEPRMRERACRFSPPESTYNVRRSAASLLAWNFLQLPLTVLESARP